MSAATRQHIAANPSVWTPADELRRECRRAVPINPHGRWGRRQEPRWLQRQPFDKAARAMIRRTKAWYRELREQEWDRKREIKEQRAEEREEDRAVLEQERERTPPATIHVSVTAIPRAAPAKARDVTRRQYAVIRRAVDRACPKLRPEERFDIRQEVALEFLTESRPIPNLKAWAFRVAHNKGANQARDEQNDRKLFAVWLRNEPRYRTGPNWEPTWYPPDAGGAAKQYAPLAMPEARHGTHVKPAELDPYRYEDDFLDYIDDRREVAARLRALCAAGITEAEATELLVSFLCNQHRDRCPSL
jgi:hypothetical protein